MGTPQCPSELGMIAIGTKCGCPEGQVVGKYTEGHCCLPGQDWIPGRGCMGEMVCPKGSAAKANGKGCYNIAERKRQEAAAAAERKREEAERKAKELEEEELKLAVEQEKELQLDHILDQEDSEEELPTVEDTFEEDIPELSPAGEGTIILNSLPWSNVTINGATKPTPFRATLSAGKHRVSFKAPDGRTHSTTVTISPNKMSVLCWNFDDNTQCQR